MQTKTVWMSKYHKNIFNLNSLNCMMVQGDHLYMTACFWFLVRSTTCLVYACKVKFYKVTKKTAMFIWSGCSWSYISYFSKLQSLVMLMASVQFDRKLLLLQYCRSICFLHLLIDLGHPPRHALQQPDLGHPEALHLLE